MSLYLDGTLGLSASAGSAVLNNAGNNTVLSVTTVNYADTTSQTTAYVNKPITTQVFTTATSGTYTTPAGVKLSLIHI